MAKEYNYIVTLGKPKNWLFDSISQLMLLFSFTAFVYNGLHSTHPSSTLYFVLAALTSCAWVYARFVAVKSSFRVALLVAAAGWLREPGTYKLIALLFIVAYLLERQVKFPQEIGVDEQGITFNHFPAKKYSWAELSNVLLKDGLITIDYKNNKLFQKELESNVSSEIEKEFNEFCSLQLKTHSSELKAL